MSSGVLTLNDNVLVVVPAFNEARNIMTVIDDLKGLGCNFIVINDCSTDNTAELVANTNSTILNLPFNLGVGGALRTGFRYATENGFDAIIQVDADGQHPISQISDLIDYSNNFDADMVIGSRFLQETLSMKVGILRRIAMRLLSFTASRAVDHRITDSTSGFRLIRGQLLRELALKLPVTYLGDTFESVLAAGHSGYKVREIPATITDRLSGRSSATTISGVKFSIKCLLISSLALYPVIARCDTEPGFLAN
jgi:glycosyltransferase involved in cell wall biosynthesis